MKGGIKMINPKINVPTIERTTLTVPEVAEYLGVSTDLIYRMAREKTIPKFNIGSRVLFKRQAIDKWIEDQIQASTEEVTM